MEISAAASSLHSLSLPAYDIHDDAIVFTARVDSPTGPCWMVKYSLAARVLWTLRLPVDTLNMPHYCRFTRGIIGIHASTRVLEIDTVHAAVIYNQDGWSSANFNRHFWKSLQRAGGRTSRSSLAGKRRRRRSSRCYFF